jgi:hypothetical protein
MLYFSQMLCSLLREWNPLEAVYRVRENFGAKAKSYAATLKRAAK